RDQVAMSLTQHTERTITTLEALDADVAETRKRGFAYDTGEFRERILSFGAAITLPSGEAVGALGISLPDVNLTDNGVEKLGGLVYHSAQSVSRKLSKA
ncbi:MAG: IclR family transcriptional regulator C-terminal domain-containing protein, partial [Sulfitobacter sp.]